MARPIRQPASVESLFKAAKKVADPVTKRRRTRYRGKRTGKSLFDFLIELFELNEIVQPEHRRTNQALINIILDEFGDYQIVKDNLTENTRHGINYYRQLYNTGKLGKQPSQVSFRYNEQGRRVDQRSGTRLLTTKQQAAWIEKYRGIAPSLGKESTNGETQTPK